jgi:hypothetical protein
MRIFLSALLAIIGVAFLVPSSAAAATDYDCADFANQAEAQGYLLSGDPYRLDADNDGIACEDLPCPCSYEEGSDGGGGGSSQPPPPPPYRLPKAAARHAALQIARKFVRRNPDVSQLKMGGCNRLGERSVNCSATALGETSTSHTTCRLQIAVRAVNRHPKATLASSNCQTHSKLMLTGARAARAIRARGAELAGKAVALGTLERSSRISFLGTAEWTQRPTPAPSSREGCFAFMEVTLTPTNQVRVIVIETGCEPAPAS